MRTTRRRTPANGPARAGAALALAFLGGLALAACSTTDPSAPERVPVSAVADGACFDLDDAGTTAFVHGSCEAPHVYEAIASERLDDPGAYPGEDAVRARADEACGERFAALVADAGTAASTYAASYLAPAPESWAAGDRSVVCLAVAKDGAAVTGTAPRR